MKLEDSLGTLRAESRAIAARCQQLETHPAIAQLALRLQLVKGAGLDGDQPRPVLAALIGGTGAGKSHLFNALIDCPEASPTSSGKRLKTTHAIVARRPAEHALLPDLGDAETRWIDAAFPSFALIDTPDLDGMLFSHREIARRVIAAADIIIYVSAPEIIASNEVLSTIHEWADRKRWFFVFNQTDRGEGTFEEKRAAFDERLKEIGFAPNDSCRFLVSAREPKEFDFSRLRSALFQERPPSTGTALAADAVVGQILHACEPAWVQQIETLAEELAAKERQVGIRILERVREGFERRQLTKRLAPILRKRIWMAMSGRSLGFLALPVGIHARLSSVFAAFQLWRFATTGISLWRIGLLAATLFQSFRATLEMQRILTVLDDELTPELDRIANEIRLFLEDRSLAPAAEAPATTLENELEEIVGSIPIAGAPFAKIVRLLAKSGERGRVAQELAPLINEAIEGRAEEAAAEFSSVITASANLLPIVAVMLACREVVQSWLDKDWLPWAFYLHATAIFALALMPGYLLICLCVGRQIRKRGSLEAMLGAVGKLPACGPAKALALLYADIETILLMLRRVSVRAKSVRHAISTEFGTNVLGATIVKAPITPSAIQ